MARELRDDQKSQLRTLRIDEGLSIKAISARTGISVGSVSKYCRGLRPHNPHFKNQQQATAAFAKACESRRALLQANATVQWQSLKVDPTIVALVALYWAEGTKRYKNHRTGWFALTNSDPGIIKAASRALQKLGYGKQALSLKIYPEHDRVECVNAWEEAIGLSVSGVSEVTRRSPSIRLWSKYGVCTLRVPKSSVLWLKIMTWIDCWRIEMGLTESWQG